MAKKAELLEQAKKLKLKVSSKNTIAELETAINTASEAKPEPAAKAEPKEESDKPLAKAGKRSAKAVAETEEKEAKEARKAETNTDATPKKAKKPVKPTRSRLERRGKKFRKAAEQIEKGKAYTINEALELATKTSTTKFDATVELHIRLNVDPKQADQNVRDTVVLPAGTGKTVRIAVFAEAEDAAKAKQAGATIAGTDEITAKLDKNQLDFDVLIAPPALMARLGKYARVLGPRGLMPNPKSGTVTTDIAKAVSEAKAGRVEYRVDSTGIIHVGIGKVSFGSKKLTDNATSLMTSVRSNKPSSIKGSFIRSMYVTTTMGPSISTVIE